MSLGGIPSSDPSSLVEFIKNLKPTDQVVLVVKSINRELRITVTGFPPSGQSSQIGGEIYRSDNGGESWRKVNQQPVGGTPAYYYGQIRIDPQDVNRLYVLGVPLYTSTDGGKTWSTIARSVHVDHHALWVDPVHPGHVMLGNDGGFHQSYDYGQTMDHYTNIPLAQFYAITADMQEPYHVYGGTQDNGSWGGPSRSAASFRGRGGISSLAWYRIGGGDGFYVQVDPSDPDIYIAESQFGAIFRVNRKTGERKFIRPTPSKTNERYRFNWNSPILMSKHDSRVIYFGGNKLFKSMNRGDDWEEISPDLTTADPAKISGNVPHCTITTISESPGRRTLLMVGTDDGKVHLTKDGGESWIDLSQNFPFRPSRWWCSRVVLSAHDENVAYACFTGYREDDFRCFVFRTIDQGKSWSSISGDLPSEPVNVICEDPQNSRLLFVGTEFGAYGTVLPAAHDMPVQWSPVPGLPRVSVQDMLIHPRDNDLILGTHGRGIYVVDDLTPLQPDTQKEDSNLAINLFQPRPIRRAQTTDRIPSLSGDRQYTGANPSESGRIWYRVRKKMEKPATLQVLDPSGKAVFNGKLKSEPGLHYLRVNIAMSNRFRSRNRTRTPSDLISLPPNTYVVELNVGNNQKPQRASLIVE